MDESDGSALAVVRELYALVGSGNFAGVKALIADDAQFIQAESLPFGGRYVGPAGFAAMAERIVGAWPGFAVQAHAYLSDEAERVAVLAELSGQGLQMPMLELWTVRGGRVIGCQPFYFDTALARQSAVSATPASASAVGRSD